MAYLLGLVLGLFFFSFVLAGFVYLVALIFRRKLTRAQFWSVFTTAFVIILVLNIIGRFA